METGYGERKGAFAEVLYFCLENAMPGLRRIS
jgi:hypothetical protein